MQLWHSSMIISIHSLSYYLPRMRLKLQQQIRNFVGKIAFQKLLTPHAQENKDSWAFHGKPSPVKVINATVTAALQESRGACAKTAAAPETSR